jgi:hypothetical protein
LHTRLAGASGARHSLRPLIGEGKDFRQNSRETRGEIADLRLAGSLIPDCASRHPGYDGRK